MTLVLLFFSSLLNFFVKKGKHFVHRFLWMRCYQGQKHWFHGIIVYPNLKIVKSVIVSWITVLETWTIFLEYNFILFRIKFMSKKPPFYFFLFSQAFLTPVLTNQYIRLVSIILNSINRLLHAQMWNKNCNLKVKYFLVHNKKRSSCFLHHLCPRWPIHIISWFLFHKISPLFNPLAYILILFFSKFTCVLTSSFFFLVF